MIENKLIEVFKNRDAFSKSELFEFFKKFEPDLSDGTLGWRIHDLNNKNIIKPIKRGLYTISNKTKFAPAASYDLIRLTKKINDSFPDVNFCIWETKWLNEFSQHQAIKQMCIIETEKDFLDSFFYELKDFNKSEVFHTPDEKTINLYVAESSQPIVIKRLVTRSPISKHTKNKITFRTPTLEKILVDIFSEDKLFYYLQGGELLHIFENALQNYDINYTKLFSYAERRDKDNELRMFLNNNYNFIIKDFFNV